MVTNAPALLGKLRASRPAPDAPCPHTAGPTTEKPLYGDLFDPDCPTRLVLDRIGDKWTVLVVLLLSDGALRFSELRARIGSVAPKVLTQTLRRMERDGLITREVFAEVPPRVEYALTNLGRSLIHPISVITDWAEQNVGHITTAQATYDRTH